MCQIFIYGNWKLLIQLIESKTGNNRCNMELRFFLFQGQKLNVSCKIWFNFC